MTRSLIISLVLFLLSAVLLLLAVRNTAMDILIFISGAGAILGLMFNIVIWLLSGFGLPFSFQRDDDEDNRKAIMVFNKINAPMQNRRDTLVIVAGLILALSLIYVYYRYLFC